MARTGSHSYLIFLLLMKKIVTKYIVLGFVGLLFLLSFGYNIFLFVKTRDLQLRQQGANLAIAQITATVESKGSIELPVFAANGQQTGMMVLVQKNKDMPK